MTCVAPDIEAIIRRTGGSAADLPFWEGCRDGRFLLHRCQICGRHYWPATRCLQHGGEAMTWSECPGTGTLYTYTVLHKAYTPAMKDKVPYVVGVIQLTEGPFMHSNIRGCAAHEVRCSMPLIARLEPHDSGLTVPIFYPA